MQYHYRDSSISTVKKTGLAFIPLFDAPQAVEILGHSSVPTPPEHHGVTGKLHKRSIAIGGFSSSKNAPKVQAGCLCRDRLQGKGIEPEKNQSQPIKPRPNRHPSYPAEQMARKACRAAATEGSICGVLRPRSGSMFLRSVSKKSYPHRGGTSSKRTYPPPQPKKGGLALA